MFEHSKLYRNSIAQLERGRYEDRVAWLFWFLGLNLALLNDYQSFSYFLFAGIQFEKLCVKMFIHVEKEVVIL